MVSIAPYSPSGSFYYDGNEPTVTLLTGDTTLVESALATASTFSAISRPTIDPRPGVVRGFRVADYPTYRDDDGKLVLELFLDGDFCPAR